MLEQNNHNIPYYMEEFLDHLRLKGVSHITLRMHTRYLETFIKFINQEYKIDVQLKDLKRTDLMKFKDFLLNKNLKVNYVQNHLSTIKSFYRFLMNEGYASVNITENIATNREIARMPKVLTEEEVKRLIQSAKAAGFYTYVLISFLVYTGARIGSVQGIRKEDVDLEKGLLRLSRNKVGDYYQIPIEPSLKIALKELLQNHPKPSSPYVFLSSRNPNTPISGNTVMYRLARLSKDASIEKRVTTIVLRNTLAVHLLSKGVSHYDVMRILGYSNINSIN
ncbi:tyrosine-type recombinase/integrase [Bacillus sp. ISL-41]|uniref:tyrosine-type recombinase/integrase n=1 Tax=Bacillus sp. ISL-41 TaxID=2819127 RepID=UPI001BE63D00|nr:tyrosine-type recombinase/integrase [Bacillus sp. ISL-41]MBT2641614.1 tyrosine-type recombinase/integrase [Bacillus sp. ISL-41]